MSTCIWRQEKFETGRHVQHLLTNAPTTGGYPKSGTSKIALFLDILSNLAMKGPQMWPKSIMTCKYYQKCPLEKKMREFRAPGAEIWLFKKKNMDRSIDLAVQHILFFFLFFWLPKSELWYNSRYRWDWSELIAAEVYWQITFSGSETSIDQEYFV